MSWEKNRAFPQNLQKGGHVPLDENPLATGKANGLGEGMIADSITQSQGGGGTSKRTSSQLLLKYPTLLVHGTPSTWFSQSELVSMASNPDYSASDDASSSLGDSNYDFVDDKSGIASDDEDHENLTHSVSSVEEREPPQPDALPPQNYWGRLPAISNTNLAPDFIVSRPHHSPSLSDPIHEAHSLPAGSTGTIKGPHTGDETNRGLFRSREDGMDHVIALEEPSAADMNPEKPFETEYTLRVFNEDESLEITSRHFRTTAPSRTLTAVIKQTMIKRWLIPQNPYKLLFVGDSAAREEIAWKVGSALDASSIDAEYAPNQYAVVRIPSFENPAAGGVELIDSTGISLIVEECHSARSTEVYGGHDMLSMIISHQGSSDRKLIESVWSGAERRVTDNWRLPDLAILYLSDSDDTPKKQTRFLARKFMDLHQVPCIIISQSPLWDKPTETMVRALDYATPHICHVTHDSSTSVVKRFPVDLNTFLNLNASQMNRNLAYLAKKHASSKPQATISNQESSKDSSVSETKDYFSPNFPYITKPFLSKHLRKFKRGFFPGLFLILGILLYQTLISVAFVGTHDPACQKQGTNMMATIQQACPKFGIAATTSVQSNCALMTSPVSLLSSKASDSRGRSHLASNSALSSFLQSHQAFASNESENFEAGIIGDCHIVLRSPGWFRRSRKAQKLAFNVTRFGSVLHHQISMPFDGVYALEIPKEDAYGTVNVSLWTTSKPIINEKLEVNFGTSWLKVSTWNNAAQAISNSLTQNRDTLVASIMIPYHQFAMNLGHRVPWRSKAVTDEPKEAGKPDTASPNQITTSAGIIQAMAADFSHKLLQGLGNGSNAASKVVVDQAQQLYKEIAGYSYNGTRLLLEESQRLPQAISGNLHKIAHDVAYLQNTHLRTTQKKALKFWWKIRGLPKQEKAQDIKRDESNMRIGKFMKKFNR